MIDDVLRELQSVGTVESEGEFTMDRGKAREKMRRFQLADPRAYVLELVQAASLKGATTVRFDIDSRDMKMQFDGRPFTAEDFDDIYGAAFTQRLDHDVLARRQLALGVNSAMALDPVRITVTSGDGQSGARLHLEPEQDDTFETVQTDTVGTLIHVRERFRLGTFVAFFKNLSGKLAEEQLLLARCHFASFEIDLEGERVDRGLSVHRKGMLELVEVEEKHTRVVAGLSTARDDAAWVDIVKDGVWITTHRLPADRIPKGLFAVVQDHALRKDVSQSDIVRDDAYSAMLDVVEQASYRALVGLAKQSIEDEAPAWAEEELVQQMLRMAGSGALLSEDESTGLAEVLRKIPLWETTTEHWVCLDELLAELHQHGSIVYTTVGRFSGMAVPGHSFVLYMRIGRGHLRESLQLLDTVFDGRLREITPLLRQYVANDKARKAWRNRPAKPQLPSGTYLARRTFESSGVRGELGLASSATEKTRIGLVVDGCLLCEEELELPLLGLRVMITSDDFEPTSTYQGISLKSKSLAAILEIIGQLGPLFASLPAPGSANHWLRACALSFLETALRGDDLADLLADGLGFPPSALDAVRRRTAPERLMLALGLGSDEPHPVTTMRLFRTLGLHNLSLAELTERARGGERFSVIDRPVSKIDADILVLSDEQREAIEPLFPGGFEDGWPQVQRVQKRVEFLARPQRQAELLAESPGVAVSIEGDGISGRLAVNPRQGHLSRRRPIQVLHQGRPIDAVEVLLVGHCIGWVESTHVAPKDDYSGVQEGAALDAVRAAILEAFARATIMIGQHAQAQMTPDRLAFLREVAALMFPSRSFRVVFDQLVKAKELKPAKRAKIYRWLYAGLQASPKTTEFEQRLWLLTRSKTIIGDAISIPVPKGAIRWASAAVDILFPPGDQPQDFIARSLAPVAPLDTLPLFRRHDGRSVTMEQIREHLSTRQAVLFIDQRKPIDLGSRLVCVLDEVEREQLRRIIGAGHVLNGASLVEREENRMAMQAMPRVQRIALAAGDALISVPIDVDADRHRTHGQVGLALEHPEDPQRRPRILLTGYREHRLLEERAEVSDRRSELVAVVNDDALTPTFDHTQLRRDRVFKQVLERCESVVPQLIGGLIGRWSELSPAQRASAWLHVLDFLVAHCPPRLEDWTDPEGLPPMVGVAAQVPGFHVVGGAMVSVAQLAEVAGRRGVIETMPAPAHNWGGALFGPERPIICPTVYELNVLTTLLFDIESVQDRWQDWQQRERRRASAPAMRLPSIEHSLVFVDLPGPMVEGRLAIPTERGLMEIDHCVDGVVVAQRTIEGVLPCHGAIFGKGVAATESWDAVRLDGNVLAVLRRHSVQMYRTLARWFQEHADHPARPWAGSLLHARLLELRKLQRESQLDLAQQLLYDELRPLPVLPLRNGRHISLQTALEEQPDELSHLGLWDSQAQRLLDQFDERDAREQAIQDLGPTSTLADALSAARSTQRSKTPADPPPAPSTPEEQLLFDVRAELTLVRDRNRQLLTHVNLDRVVVQPLPRRRRSLVAYADDTMVVINRTHPVVERALAEPDDPMWRSYISSSLYTALNVWLEEVTDADEMHFLGLMGQMVAG